MAQESQRSTKVVDLPNVGPVEVPSEASLTELDVFNRSQGDEGIGPFARGVRDATVGFSSVDEALQALSAILDQPSLIPQALVSAQTDQLSQGVDRAKEAVRLGGAAFQQPSFNDATVVGSNAFLAGLEALGRFAAGLTPLVGPAAAETADTFAQGDISEGAGRVTGMLAPLGLRQLRRVRSEKPTGPIPATLGERTGSRPVLKAEGFVEGSIFGKGRFGEFRQAQSQAIRNLVDDMAGRLGRFQGTAEDFGRFVSQNLDEALQARRDLGRQLYHEIDTLSKGVTVPTGRLKRFASPILRRLNEESALIDPQQLAGVRLDLERILAAPRRVSFAAAQDARSDLLRVVRQIGDPLPGKRGGIAKGLAREIDASMEAAARDSGVAGLASKVRQANAVWKETNEIFNDGWARKILNDLPPERISEALVRADFESLDAIKRMVPQRTWRALKADFIQRQFLDKAMSGEAGGPSLGAEVQRRFGLTAQDVQVVNGRKLRNIIFGDGHVPTDRIRTIFDDAEITELQAIGEAARTVGLAPSSVFSAMMDVGTIGGMMVDPLRAVAVGGSIHALSVLMTSPKGLTAVRGLVQAIGSGNTSRRVFWANRALDALADMDLPSPDDVESLPPPEFSAFVPQLQQPSR